MPAALLVRWAAVAASLASVALPVCVAGSPVGRPSEEERPVFFVRPLGHQSHGDAEGRYAPLSMLVAPTIGLLSNTTAVEGVTPAVAGGARYVERSHVLRLLSGRWKYLPGGRTASVVVPPEDPTARLQIAESRDWLAAGRVPGNTATQRAAAERALLAMRALLRPNGAMAAGWTPGWTYSWPRDSSFASAAFAHTGHDAEAYRILRYSAATQRKDGTWDARTELDGSGPPDSRRWQLDANGWVPWATWQWYRTAPPAARRARLAALYPMIRKAADRSAASLGPDGLPPASPDYWEVMTTSTNIGTAAPLLAGLHAAADLADALDRPGDAARWSGAAGRLSTGISRTFAPLGYQRTVDGQHGRDSAVAFMAPPSTRPRPTCPGRWTPRTRHCCCPTGGSLPGTTRPRPGVRTPGPPAPRSSPSHGRAPGSRRRPVRSWTGSWPSGTRSGSCPRRWTGRAGPRRSHHWAGRARSSSSRWWHSTGWGSPPRRP